MSRVKILALLSVFTFVTSLVAIGHGIAPIALLLGISLLAFVNPNSGEADPVWVGIFVLAWMAIIALMVSCLLRGHKSWWTALSGALLCGFAWTGFVFYSDPPVTTFIFSGHFMVVEVLLLRHLFLNPPE